MWSGAVGIVAVAGATSSVVADTTTAPSASRSSESSPNRACGVNPSPVNPGHSSAGVTARAARCRRRSRAQLPIVAVSVSRASGTESGW